MDTEEKLMAGTREIGKERKTGKVAQNVYIILRQNRGIHTCYVGFG